MAKPIVLIFVGYYIPGYKAGGILRSVVNLVDHLHGVFQFKIVTRDRDLGDSLPYPNIKYNEWQSVGNASVCYLSPEGESLAQLRGIVRRTPHDVIYLTSFFEPLTIKVLLNMKLRRIERKPIVLTPFGEFAWASLRLKYPKKALFMRIARLAGLYAPVTWRASNATEADEMAMALKIHREAIHVIRDLPTIAEGSAVVVRPDYEKDGDALRVVFLSRISPEKNLDFALKVLARVKSKVNFDIIGPIENREYWSDCQKLLQALPAHVTARSLGSIKPSEVLSTLARYDLMLFPTGGEAFGHVIAESLSAGTPVLISNNTPWQNLTAKGLGWDLPLDDPSPFVDVVDEVAMSSESDRLERRKSVKNNIGKILADPTAVLENQKLFLFALKQ